MKPYFIIIKKSTISKARVTELRTPHGIIHGPFFMPIATRGAVKNLTVDELKKLGAEILLSNTYHLLLNPGMDVMKKCGGLHTFMNWNGPILTDSGGYQVFSLSEHRKITEAGVDFRSPQNGKQYHLTPEISMQIQNTIGSDIIMAFDECPPYPCSRAYAEESLKMTTRWAKRCKEEWRKDKNQSSNLPAGRQVSNPKSKKLLFGIMQGSIYKDLRIQSAQEMVALDFDGYAIGGVAVGEPREKMKKVLEWVIPELPENKPRYLMGLGRPEEIIFAVKNGIDMFDCVIPTREARHGRLYLWKSPSPLPLSRHGRGESSLYYPRPFAGEGGGKFYTTINIQNAKFAKDLSPINNTNLKQYTKAYLHHLFHTNEPLAMRLATLNNLDFYLTLMRQIRDDIKKNKI